jgi:hypothetical protein
LSVGYLKTYGYTGANPAHSDFVAAPKVSRDGKTVGLSPHDCRRLLDAPQVEDLAIKDESKRIIPVGIRDRAIKILVADYQWHPAGDPHVRICLWEPRGTRFALTATAASA